MTSILFVCTGNICRSPLAEASLRDYLQREGIRDLLVSSAGTHALTGHGPTREAMSAARLWNLDISEHRARQADDAVMKTSDIILAMTQRHLAWLEREFPHLRNRIYLTMLFPRRLAGESRTQTDVPDPIGESVEFYIRVLEMLRPALPRIAAAALGEEKA